MNLTEGQVRDYRRTGFLLVKSVFDAQEVDVLRTAYCRDSEIPGDHRIAEADSGEIRAVYASHLRQPEFEALVRSARLLEPVWRLLTERVYIYQFKINAKQAFGGGSWAWHKDYVAWKLVDNLPAPNLINVGVFLDDVTEFNGPLILVPGSHRDALIGDEPSADNSCQDGPSAQHLDPNDIALSNSEMAGLVHRHGLLSAKAPAGSVLFFDPEIVHGSAPNMSPFPRKVLLVTYNDVLNQPRPVGSPRPEYLVGRDTAPLHIRHGGLAGAVRAARADRIRVAQQ